MAVTRRNFARGAAWSVPAISVAAAAPATAISANPASVTLSRFSNYDAPSSDCDGDAYQLSLDGTTQGSSGVTIKNANTTAVSVTGLYTVFLLTKKNLTFTADTGYTNWSNPAATGLSQVINGTTYYQYRSNYSGTVNVPKSGTSYVLYSFTSACTSGTTGITGGQAFATVGGVTIQSPASTVQGTCTTDNCQ